MTETLEHRWQHANTPEAEAANRALADTVNTWIKNDERARVEGLVAGWQGADIIALALRLRAKRARKLIEWLPEEMGLGVLAEVDPRLRALLVQDATDARLVKLLKKLDHDRAVRLLHDLPREMRERVVEKLPEAWRWRQELRYLEESAGAMMRRGFLAVTGDRRMGELIAEIRTRQHEIDRLDGIYVVDTEGRLTGYLRVRDLVICDPDTLVQDIARHDVVSVNAAVDREEALRLAEDRGLRVLAVTDDKGLLVGRISAAELTEISRAEAAEDLLKLAGVSPDSTTHDAPLQIVRRRVPWLLAGLAGASVAAAVIGSFEEELAQAAVLASFIPVIMATAGNAGIQASTVTVQGLTAGEDAFEDLLPRLGREFLGALMNGAMIGVVMALLVVAASLAFTIERPLMLAVTVALSLLIVTALASTVGAAIPAILDRLGLDPATATGIFITTANDVFGVLAFFYIAAVLYL